MQVSNSDLTSEKTQQKVEQFAGQVVTDLAAAMAGVMTNLGHKLRLYRPWQRQVPSLRMTWPIGPARTSAQCGNG